MGPLTAQKEGWHAHANAFTRLCNLTDALLAQVRALPESPARARLLQVVDAFDDLIDDVIGLDILALARIDIEEEEP